MLQAAKELAARDGSTAGRVISALARRGLQVPEGKGRVSRSIRGGVPVLPSRGEVVTLDHVGTLMEQEGL